MNKEKKTECTNVLLLKPLLFIPTDKNPNRNHNKIGNLGLHNEINSKQ